MEYDEVISKISKDLESKGYVLHQFGCDSFRIEDKDYDGYYANEIGTLFFCNGGIFVQSETGGFTTLHTDHIKTIKASVVKGKFKLDIKVVI